jgi:hypothetical protein
VNRHGDDSSLNVVVQVVVTAAYANEREPCSFQRTHCFFACDSGQFAHTVTASDSTGISSGMGLPRSLRVSM